MEWKRLTATVEAIRTLREPELPSAEYVDRVARELRLASQTGESQNLPVTMDPSVTCPAEPITPSIAHRRRIGRRMITVSAAVAAVLLLGVSLGAHHFPRLLNAPTAEAEHIRVISTQAIKNVGASSALHPQYIPGTQNVMYEQRDHLWVLTPDKGVRPFFPSPGPQARDAAWSSDGKEIAFVRTDHEQEGIWISNKDGSGTRRLTSPDWRETFDETPAWSPDGKWLAFTRRIMGIVEPHGVRVQSQNVWIIRADGTGLHKVTSGTHPTWSPDGKRLALSVQSHTDDATPWEIWTVDQDGKRAQKLTEGREPTWSPDGRTIVFTRSTRSVKTVHLPADSKVTARVVSSRSEVWAIDVPSRVVTQLTYSPDNEPSIQRWLNSLQNQPTSSTVPLSFGTSGLYDDWAPSWSRDGKSILFTRNYNDEKAPHFVLYRLDVSSPT